MVDHHPIRAVIIGADQCAALGRKVRAATPVLALCRELVATGHDPNRSLHVYRDGVLALRIRSIGEAARLRVATHGVGFEAAQECTTASPMRFPDRAAALASNAGISCCGSESCRSHG